MNICRYCSMHNKTQIIMWKKIGLYSVIIGLGLLATNCENQGVNEVTDDLEDDNEEKVAPTMGPSKDYFTFDKLASDLEVVSMKDEYDNTVEYSRKKSDFAKQGLYLRKDTLGRIIEAANYENDTLHGSRIIFYVETGTRQIVEHYSHGNFDGLYQVFHPNGKLEQEGNYVNNVMDSTWVRYYDTGQLMEEVTFRDNEENGPFKEFHPNGKLKAEGTYKGGDNEHGSLKLYDENGEHIKTMNCKNGICKTIWKKEEIQ